MRSLYIVFVLSMTALIWTAIAVARHIKRHEAEREQQHDHPEETVSVPPEEKHS